jgi:glycosyltransferase involved in cell wall biosynthesis
MALAAFRYIYFMDLERSVEDSVSLERPIRVLRVIARMNVGGPAIQIAGLMTQIPKQEFSQLLVTGYCEEDESDYLESHDIDIPIIRIKSLGRSLNLLNDVSALFAIRRIMKQYRPDIVHTHTAKAGLLGRLASISTLDRHIRVHTFHGHLLHGYFSNFKTQILVLIERLLARVTKAFVAVGDNVKRDLIFAGVGNLSKYTVIGPGLSLQPLPSRVDAGNTLKIDSGNFNVSWIGRAVKVKAPMKVIEIAQESSRLRLDINFLIVGDGPLIQPMKEEVRKNSLSVSFLGWQNEIENILAISDIVILTSENEGTPVALIQAQMAGIPVITTNVGSASEVLIHGETGYCETYSAKVFVDRIRALKLDHKARQSFGKKAARFANNKFSLQTLIYSHTNLYKKLIDQSNS